MEITLENFSDVKKNIAKDGIKKVNYGTQGNALSFTMKDDKEFELDSINFIDFKTAELIRPGRKM
jgi:hypothetical protein